MKVRNENYTNVNLEQILFKINKVIKSPKRYIKIEAYLLVLCHVISTSNCLTVFFLKLRTCSEHLNHLENNIKT